MDALPIARLQLETLYTFCFLLQSAENVRLFLKNNWKKKYIRFLLEREERRNLQRFDEFYMRTGQSLIDMLQGLSSVSDEERQTIEQDEDPEHNLETSSHGRRSLGFQRQRV